jgi:hypothetical protein
LMMGSLAGWVLPYPRFLLMWGSGRGTCDSPIEDFIILILPSLSQSFLNKRSTTSSNYWHLSLLGWHLTS